MVRIVLKMQLLCDVLFVKTVHFFKNNTSVNAPQIVVYTAQWESATVLGGHNGKVN